MWQVRLSHATTAKKKDTGRASAPFIGHLSTRRFLVGGRTGKRTKAWDGANPKQETFKQWLKFIKTHFEGKGQPARVDGAPSFDDYKDRAANGAGP